MCPEKAKVFIAEDNPIWMKFQKEAMARGGHQVVVEVGDIRDGMAAIPKARELGVNVALIDGRIPAERTDGTRLTEALRQAIPDIKVVDISSFGDAIKNADAKMPKSKYDLEGMGQLVKDL